MGSSIGGMVSIGQFSLVHSMWVYFILSSQSLGAKGMKPSQPGFPRHHCSLYSYGGSLVAKGTLDCLRIAACSNQRIDKTCQPGRHRFLSKVFRISTFPNLDRSGLLTRRHRLSSTNASSATVGTRSPLCTQIQKIPVMALSYHCESIYLGSREHNTAVLFQHLGLDQRFPRPLQTEHPLP